MPLQAPSSVTYEGRAAEALPLPGFRPKKAVRLTAGAATGSTQVALPLSSNGQPLAVYKLTMLGSDAIFYAIGTSAVTCDHTTDNFDDVIDSKASVHFILNKTNATHIVAITESSDSAMVIAGVV